MGNSYFPLAPCQQIVSQTWVGHVEYRITNSVLPNSSSSPGGHVSMRATRSALRAALSKRAFTAASSMEQSPLKQTQESPQRAQLAMCMDTEITKHHPFSGHFGG